MTWFLEMGTKATLNDFIQTGNQDFINKKSHLFGIKNIAVKGESIIEQGAILRGDLRRQETDRC